MVCESFEKEKTLPKKTPMTPVGVTGSLKKSIPAMAIGNLLSAPTMLYVVEEVTRIDQEVA